MCLFCWHDALDRCDACLRHDPASAAPALPWEQEGLSFGARYLGTLGTAFSPMRSAPAFAAGDLGPAVACFLRSAIPLAVLAGIIPHTRTVLFGPGFSTTLLGQVSTVELVADVIRAAGVQLAYLLVTVLALILPYASLVRAYAPGRQVTAARVLLYRLWLVQGGALLQGLLAWAGPDTAGYFNVVALVPFTAQILVMVAMGFAARLACGLGMLMSIVVVALPFLLLILVEGLFALGLLELLGPIGAAQ